MLSATLYVRPSPAYPRSVDAQLCALHAYAVGHDFSVIRTLSDATATGSKTTRRPGFATLVRMVERSEVEAVVVCSLNLLARSLPELLALLGKASERGVRIVALDEEFDSATTSSTAKDMVAMLSGYQRFERQEAVLIGQQAARQAGVRFGRPPVSAAKVARVREALAAGAGVRAAARAGGVSPAKAVTLKREMAGMSTGQ